MNHLTEDSLQAILDYVKNSMGIMYDDDDELFKQKIKAHAIWLCEQILYEDNFVIQPETTELILVAERTRYDLSNSLDIFQKNYVNDIQNVVSRHAYLDYKSKVGGGLNATRY